MTALLGEKGSWPGPTGASGTLGQKGRNPRELWGGVPMATRFSRGLPALKPPGVTWGPGLAAAGVGEEAVGGPGGWGRGVPR